MNDEIILQCENLQKYYQDYTRKVEVLLGINLSVRRGESVAILGPSGSGKSTLLHILGGLDTASSGRISCLGQDWQTMTERERCSLRNKHMGFVYQFHHLLPEFNALENVAMPLLIRKVDYHEARAKAEALLTKMGMGDRLKHNISQLSGGERQRTAIARAIVTEPDCVLADEPTGNLDQKTAQKVFDEMLQLRLAHNSSLLIVTHDMRLAEQMDRVLVLEDGKCRPAV
jgi:lipoprotein-releasing system ATP-binding protein